MVQMLTDILNDETCTEVMNSVAFFGKETHFPVPWTLH